VRFYCIGDEDTVRGFRLAGVEGCVPVSAPEALKALHEAAARSELGIVLLTQSVAARIRNQVDTFRMERDRPLLVEIPDPNGPLPGRKTLRMLAHSAVGIRVDKATGA